MKIAFIVGVFPSLSETFILNQITGLLDLGHEVEIFSLMRPTDRKVHDVIEKRNLMSLVGYFPAIPKNPFLRILKGKFLFFRYFLKHPKRLMKSIRLSGFDKDILSLKVLFSIIPFLGKDFDIIHCHFGHIGDIGVYIKKGGVQGKLVTTFYGYDLSTYILGKGENVYARLFSHGDLFLPICDYFRKKLISLSCDESRIRLYPIGIDLKKHKYILRGRSGKDRVKILTAGRLIEKKGYEYSIRACAVLMKKGKNFHYTIIGDGPLIKKLTDLVDTLGLNERINFAGGVNRRELLDYYSKSDIFLLPSVKSENGEEEGTPAALIEAQASGLPVVSSFHSGIPEIVAHEKTGYLAKEKDSDSIAMYLEMLIDNPGLRLRMGKQGRKYVEDRFDINRLSRILEGFYGDLIKG